MYNYFLKDVMDYQGHSRTDDRYPNRIGSDIEFLSPITVSRSLLFNYKKTLNGKIIDSGTTKTSYVINIVKNADDTMFIFTKNSIYVFYPLMKE